MIAAFISDETRFLSNFYPHRKDGSFYPHQLEIHYNGIVFDCVETAYQAAKTNDGELQKLIRNLTPYLAKELGSGGYEVREDWPEVRYKIMYDLVRQKFANHPELKMLLLATGDEELQEGNDWGDIYWGVCNGIGENHLGRILMQIRNKLK